jgi:hypothetical protein
MLYTMSILLTGKQIQKQENSVKESLSCESDGEKSNTQKDNINWNANSSS